MKQTIFKVSETEKIVHYISPKKAEERRETTKAGQSAIIMDLARALRVDSNDYNELTKQVNQFNIDLS